MLGGALNIEEDLQEGLVVVLETAVVMEISRLAEEIISTASFVRDSTWLAPMGQRESPSA